MSVNVYNKETDELIRVAGNLDPNEYAKKSEFVDAGTFSFDEVVVGTWNGKTRYRKCFRYTTNAVHTSAWSQTHGIENIDEVVDVGGTAVNADDGLVFDINTSYPTASGGPFFFMCRANKTQIQLFNGGWKNVIFRPYIEYTKTTD